ncbi:hypothetical protein TrCOL_g11875 [Triparma columacea]|uniref:Uncharacterized protein n=1 Tax=Triparma columacea TaxID=722753 RepID=A0A9W7GAQ8_9STRA|nr:hypothetical protein TrCOL_g11875 [Triparma columacea]
MSTLLRTLNTLTRHKPLPSSTSSLISLPSSRYLSTPTSPPSPVTIPEIHDHQTRWGHAIRSISTLYLTSSDFISAASSAASDLYGYNDGTEVIFKPTKATHHPFRPTPESAMSYFVGGSNYPSGYPSEDFGFAINSGKGWSDVTFKNHTVMVVDGLGFAGGVYEFTCATEGEVVTVEYTKGYKRGSDGIVRLFLHHSSVPYKP